VKNGFVVLAFDPIGQGERRQYYGPGVEEFDELLSPTLEHCTIGGLLSLLGESAAGWFAWDAIRAVDYLSQRPDVNAAEIGCADHTDTGWNALFHCALDDRVQCASIHVRGSGRRWPVDMETWNVTDDPEQFLFCAAENGIDFPDVLASLAPRPLQALVEDQSGAFDDSAAYVKKRYTQLGPADRFTVEKAVAGEDWPKTLRMATVRWFARWLRNGSGVVAETDVVPEPYSALKVAQIGKPIYSIIRERASKLSPPFNPVRVKAALRSMVGLSDDAPAPFNPRELTSDRLEGYTFSNIEFLSEPGIYIPAQLYRPDRSNGDCILYTTGDVTAFTPEADDDLGGPAAKSDDDRDASHDFPSTLARRGYTVLNIDVRGLGRTMPTANRRDIRGPYEHLHNSDVALANMAWSLGDSLFAMRVRDVLRASGYASQFGRVRLVGTDMGALWALVAGASEVRYASVTIQRGLASYRLLTEHVRYMQATSQFIPAVLQRFDLPQVAALIAPRQLTIIDPAGHQKQPIDPETAKQIYAPAQAEYKKQNAASNFKLLFDEELEDQFS